MNIQDIIDTRQQLEKELKEAASTMTLSSSIKEIRDKIKQNQNACPHFDNERNLENVEGICPYCGKKLGEN